MCNTEETFIFLLDRIEKLQISIYELKERIVDVENKLNGAQKEIDELTYRLNVRDD